MDFASPDFRFRFRIALPLIAAASLTAVSASAGARPTESMILGAQTAPPLGFVEMCARTPQACGDDPVAIAVAAKTAAPRASAYDRYFWSVALSGDAPAAGYIPRRPRVETARLPRGFGRGVGAQHDAPPSVAATPGLEDARPTTVSANRASWSRLNRINRQVNRAIRERSDLSSVGVADRWSLPIADGRLVGDCEDFALEKRRLLIEAGISPQAMSIALVRTRWGESHAVLLVAMEGGEYVLDSLSPWISHWAALDYRWVQRQAPGSSLRWVSITAS